MFSGLLTDCFQFRITLMDRPATPHGILSAVSSVYDPLGFLAPFVLNGKRPRILVL